ncbi:hypothetical protein ANCCAN_20600 [Ancylostoma caninum]|uniref:Uncharacterized protein n=1 Tax=Ancylostoma caninum TaxID=29170 RepID=A0A368FPX0_ANCCA|nr:hypothetical protein ANCCAN_20600 [Ancylostoma caninum]
MGCLTTDFGMQNVIAYGYWLGVFERLSDKKLKSFVLWCCACFKLIKYYRRSTKSYPKTKECRKKKKVRADPFGGSPFAVHDFTSRSAMLRIRTMNN